MIKKKPDPPPPNGKTESDLMDDLRRLSITAAHEFLAGFDRLRELREDWETDEHGRPTAAKRRREKMKGMAYELARHEIQHAEKILSLSHTHADMLFDHARAVLGKVKAKRPTSAPVVDLSIPEKPREKFKIRNTFEVDADARFDLDPFRDQSGRRVRWLKVTELRTDPAPVVAGRTALVHIEVGIATDEEQVAAYRDKKLQKPAKGVYFAELKTFLVGDIEQCVSRRLLRVRVSEKEPVPSARGKSR